LNWASVSLFGEATMSPHDVHAGRRRLMRSESI
jgi:hypothetical protein